MIDLHSHTTESDGTASPAELVACARSIGLEALAITDHDTFRGYRAAAPLAADSGLRLICGIELSTRFRGRTVHLLGYWPGSAPTESFCEYVDGIQASRRERNQKLIEKLQASGISITLEEVEAVGKSITGRPHFARVLVQKGLAASVRDAFDRYIGETAPAYIERESPPIEVAIKAIDDSGGISSLAHPIRTYRPGSAEESEFIAGLAEAGLRGIECYHSDHTPEAIEVYLEYARRFKLMITGGSDYHGGNKPDIQLGTGRAGNLSIPASLLAQFA